MFQNTIWTSIIWTTANYNELQVEDFLFRTPCFRTPYGRLLFGRQLIITSCKLKISCSEHHVQNTIWTSIIWTTANHNELQVEDFLFRTPYGRLLFGRQLIITSRKSKISCSERHVSEHHMDVYYLDDS